MTQEAVQAAADQANRAGRLHPSQRGKVLDSTFWVCGLLTAVAIAAAVLAPVALGVSSAERANLNTVNAAIGRAPVSYWSLNWQLYLLTALLLAVAVVPGRAVRRRLAEVRSGKLDQVTGWTHDYGHVHQRPTGGRHAMYLFEATDRMTFTYLVVNGKTYRLDHELTSRVLGNRTNTALFTPRSKILVNVIPA
ncbi:hypothetical protein [Amycolatopsis jejuensis]|uniref:hypothetical protein n=1 Tax=Amycolatopsis jejuensis TaxID=330084 RepID=UPI0005254557|nr:hypothetical protein [Amycolatopsis jejuensis]